MLLHLDKMIGSLWYKDTGESFRENELGLPLNFVS